MELTSVKLRDYYYANPKKPVHWSPHLPGAVNPNLPGYMHLKGQPDRVDWKKIPEEWVNEAIREIERMKDPRTKIEEFRKSENPIEEAGAVYLKYLEEGDAEYQEYHDRRMNKDREAPFRETYQSMEEDPRKVTEGVNLETLFQGAYRYMASTFPAMQWCELADFPFVSNPNQYRPNESSENYREQHWASTLVVILSPKEIYEKAAEEMRKMDWRLFRWPDYETFRSSGIPHLVLKVRIQDNLTYEIDKAAVYRGISTYIALHQKGVSCHAGGLELNFPDTDDFSHDFFIHPVEWGIIEEIGQEYYRDSMSHPDPPSFDDAFRDEIDHKRSLHKGCFLWEYDGRGSFVPAIDPVEMIKASVEGFLRRFPEIEHNLTSIRP
ncbi:hypothetical protein HYU13_04105 [Candidatus Woesearchaeota archaeon]|nr:hypothetical protein [Candidatus Woesearchaeota archaeon]